ncbi:MAG: hypothetical protein ACAH11_07110 [Sphingomonas sp.]
MTIRNFLIAAALAVTGVATPALAADVATLPCVRQELSTETLDAIRDTARRSAEGEMGVRPSEETRDALMAAAGRCAAKYGWTADEAQYAGLYTLAELRLAAMEPIAKRRGVDLAKIRIAVGEMTQDERGLLRKGDRQGSVALLRELTALGVTVPEEFATAQLYGRLATILLVLEEFRNSFAGN